MATETIDNAAKQQRFDGHLENLSSQITREEEELGMIEDEFALAKDERAAANKKHDQIEKRVKDLQKSIGDNQAEFHRVFRTGWESWNPDLIERGEIKEVSEAWRNEDAKTHFNLSDAVWDALLGEVDTPTLNVGQLSDILNRISSGFHKIKGIGEKKIDDISEQFENFWSRMKQKQTPDDKVEIEIEVEEQDAK